MKLKKYNIILIALLLLTGCFKDELPILKKDRGSVTVGSAELGSSYSKMVYYSLLNKQNVETIDKFSWDIKLSGTSKNPYIKLNTAKSMVAYQTKSTSFSEIKDTVGKLNNKLIDYQSGYSDSLALTDIFNNKNVYIIDLGIDGNFNKLELLLFKASVVGNQYFIEYSKIDGSDYKSLYVSFNENVNHILYNFKTNNSTPEPIAEDWDLLFTQYQHVYYNPFQTYQVVGCLINSKNILAAKYTGKNKFNEITIADTLDCKFSNIANTIGFDWKYFSLTSNNFTVFNEKNYILKHKTGKIFKLHFIDFYNKNGIKGTPVFEFQEL